MCECIVRKQWQTQQQQQQTVGEHHYSRAIAIANNMEWVFMAAFGKRCAVTALGKFYTDLLYSPYRWLNNLNTQWECFVASYSFLFSHSNYARLLIPHRNQLLNYSSASVAAFYFILWLMLMNQIHSFLEYFSPAIFTTRQTAYFQVFHNCVLHAVSLSIDSWFHFLIIVSVSSDVVISASRN